MTFHWSKSLLELIFLSIASLQQPEADQPNSIMEESYYQTKKDFTTVARSIYITACCNISDLQSEEYQRYICERVFANDCIHCLLWEMAEYDRIAKNQDAPHGHHQRCPKW